MILSGRSVPVGVIRWLAFNLVGFLGVIVQLGVLALVRGWLGLHYILATIIAVECAVLHNFAWHEHWTWSDRTGDGMGRVLKRLVRFNLSTGAVSIAGNAALMAMLVDWFSVHYLVANLIAITACSIINFLVSDRIVFVKSRKAKCKASGSHSQPSFS